MIQTGLVYFITGIFAIHNKDNMYFTNMRVKAKY
jgi:hypothetical protein